MEAAGGAHSPAHPNAGSGANQLLQVTPEHSPVPPAVKTAARYQGQPTTERAAMNV